MQQQQSYEQHVAHHHQQQQQHPSYSQPHRLHVQSSPDTYPAGPSAGYGSSMRGWGSSPGGTSAVPGHSLARPISPGGQRPVAQMVSGRAYPAAGGARPAGHFNVPLP
jgi:hypothetical protein